MDTTKQAIAQLLGFFVSFTLIGLAILFTIPLSTSLTMGLIAGIGWAIVLFMIAEWETSKNRVASPPPVRSGVGIGIAAAFLITSAIPFLLSNISVYMEEFVLGIVLTSVPLAILISIFFQYKLSRRR